MKKHMALYGAIRIPRSFCPVCRQYAFVIDGQLQCCELKVEEGFLRKTKRISQGSSKRRRPSRTAIRTMMERQENKCIYCEIEFGTAYVHPRTKKLMKTIVCCDHVIPFNYSQDNRDINFLLACGACNGIKSDLMFDTLEDARNFIRHRRIKKGFIDDIYIR